MSINSLLLFRHAVPFVNSFRTPANAPVRVSSTSPVGRRESFPAAGFLTGFADNEIMAGNGRRSRDPRRESFRGKPGTGENRGRTRRSLVLKAHRKAREPPRSQPIRFVLSTTSTDPLDPLCYPRIGKASAQPALSIPFSCWPASVVMLESA